MAWVILLGVGDGCRAGESTLVRFGITADAHVQGSGSRENNLLKFVEAMDRWKADFVIDLGDLAIQVSEGPTTKELHDGQLENLKRVWKIFRSGSCPAYAVMGNHDVGWIRGGDEVVAPDDLCAEGSAGEDITKSELLAVTGLPHRYYSFDVKGVHFIVLDGNNDPAAMQDVPRGRDGVSGGYCIDRKQLAWLADDLAANRGKTKVVFCHEELHHTPVEGSGEGGDVPFEPVGKEYSYVDNGWQVREMFSTDGSVLVCFHGHKHESRWTVYGGVHYITVAAVHRRGSFARVTISDKLTIEGEGEQRSYASPLPARVGSP
ncbi:MAG: metallophosphoesterase [Planctomycetota bacterium]